MATGNQDRLYDLIVVGGGITGAGIVRDAALRGLSCLLLEKEDFGAGVSSKTTRLIHGGLRYLANLEIDLVSEALRERAILRRLAPNLIRPIPLVIPIYKGDAHGRAVISLGIHLYDLLSRDRDIPHYFTSGPEKTLAFEPRLNRNGLTGSALFYDHQLVMPERLVIENIVSARASGATVMNHCRVEKIGESGSVITVTARDVLRNENRTFRAKLLVNAGGPWTDSVRKTAGIDGRKIINPSKGIHLVLPRLSDQALFVTSRDGRMFFIVPLAGYSLIGTTDTAYRGDLDDVHADGDDVDYLLSESRRILPGLNITREAILYTYAGVRPLAYSGSSESKISRKHRVIREGRSGRIITIAGGKLTTYRAMAKDAVDAVCRVLGVKSPCRTDTVPFRSGLPGAYEDYLNRTAPELSARYKIGEETVRHLIGWYGARAAGVLDLAAVDSGLRERISPASPDIHAQIAYSVLEEGAKTLSDIVLRRMHIGMTGARGADAIEAIARTAARELKWSREEEKQQVENFRKELEKDLACLGRTGTRKTAQMTS